MFLRTRALVDRICNKCFISLCELTGIGKAQIDNANIEIEASQALGGKWTHYV